MTVLRVLFVFEPIEVKKAETKVSTGNVEDRIVL